MNLHRIILSAALALTVGQAGAQPSNAANAGLLPLPVNRIVGLWEVKVTAGPCTGGPTQTFIALNTYHAGGTLSDINNFTPTARAAGQGLWSYEGRNQYRTRFQFYRFTPAGAFDGVQDIRTTVHLNAHATQYTNTIYARVLNPDGSLRAEVCGSGIANRIGIN